MIIKMNETYLNRFFFILLSILPISFLFGPAISLINILFFDIFFLIVLFLNKETYWTKNITVKIFILLYLYLIFNSFISIEVNLGLSRNFGFIRLLIFFLGVNYFFYKYKNFDKIIIFWSVIILIVVIDIFVEAIFGSNILGYGSNERRVASFFNDEQIVGGFVASFFLMLTGYYLTKLEKLSKISKIIIYGFIFIFLLSIIVTGERSNSIKTLISLLILFFIFHKINIKLFMGILLISACSLTIIFNQSDYLKNRYTDSIIYSMKTYVFSFNHGDPYNYKVGNLYAQLHRSGYDVFKKYPYFGVGNKNYRHEACVNKTIKSYVCNTHPHQVYFELLSEHGLLGTLFLLTIFSFLLFRGFKENIAEKNFIGIGCFCYIFTAFLPLIPSGSFFTDYNISLFFINLSVMYASSKQLNIFYKR
jgi:O-antigen ligase|tara:strand:- start:182 stop:1441 length:1260 start_codon:yes stop_codon:yes gene_type:complete